MSEQISLNEDLLLYIFEMNTHSFESELGCVSIYHGRFVKYDTLDTARYTSQVCRPWRNILLRSPAIWGNVIDLNEFAKASHHWFEEVLRRTGSARLSIYGQLNGTCKALFAALIDEQWHRVRRLDVELLDDKNIDSRTWDIFWTRPAPNLEKFLIKGLLPAWDRHRPLFAGSAPSLRRIHSTIFDPSDPWVSQLSSFTLSMPFKTFDALNILLRCSARLDSLVIQNTIDDNESKGWTRPIHLPYLSKLNISGMSSTAISYLSNIIPRCHCTLNLCIFRSSMTQAILDRIIQLTMPYATSYFHLRRPTALFIKQSASHISVKPMQLFQTDLCYFKDPEFSIDLNLASMESMEPRILSLRILDVLTFANLEVVTNLFLHIGDMSWLKTLSESESAPLGVFLSLIAVERIFVCPVGHCLDLLNFLHEVHEYQSTPGEHNSGALFPHLTDLIIKTSLFSPTSSEVNMKTKLLNFLSNRRHKGFPVLTLDITEYVRIHGDAEWEFLDDEVDVEVIRNIDSEEESDDAP